MIGRGCERGERGDCGERGERGDCGRRDVKSSAHDTRRSKLRKTLTC